MVSFWVRFHTFFVSTIPLVDLLTGLRTNLLKLKHHAGFAKLSRLVMKTCHSKYSFALSIYTDVRTKPR